MKQERIKKIMIFGKPGSGKSTFATSLSGSLGIPLHQIQQNIVDTESWIIDGNSTRSLEMRWMHADLVVYFNYPKTTCVYRIFKRFFRPNKSIDDRAEGCKETVSLKLLKYMWGFENRVKDSISLLKSRYPDAMYREIKNDDDLHALKQLLLQNQLMHL